MEIKLQHGIDKLLFGMTPKYVESLYGKPSKVYEDEEGNTVYMYNKENLRITFYVDEEDKLGYISTTNPEVVLFNTTIIGKDWDLVQGDLAINKLQKWEDGEEDGVEIYFNEDNWINIFVEYGKVIEVEVGAVFSEKEDEFEWKFKA